MSIPRSMSARRLRIAEILTRREVCNQAELQELLADDGFEVTQATVSRDLDELRATKVPNESGELVYALPGEGGDHSVRPPQEEQWHGARLARVGAELISSIDSSANNVVIRTPPGAAQYVASALDRTEVPGIIGTVAGDGTILLVTREPQGGSAVAAELLSLINRRARSQG